MGFTQRSPKSLGQLFRLTAFPSLTPKQFALLPADFVYSIWPLLII